MSDAFREPSPEEIHHALLQFMGQNMGDLKSLDENLITKTNTLQGMTLHPRSVLNSIPIQRPPVVQAPQPQPQHIQEAPVAHVQQVSEPVDPNAPVQLEFNFDTSPYSKSIFIELTELKRIVNQHTVLLNSINEKIDELNKSFFLKENSSQELSQELLQETPQEVS